MNLHSDKEAFKEIIALAAEHFGYEQSHVEKDYWVSKILRDISMSEYADKTYFKGGTSLSKAYGLIERFSEDLDLFVFTGDKGASKQAEKTLNKKLSKHIAELNSDIYKEDLSETGGNYRKLYFSYDNVFQGVGLKEHLEVEIKSCDLPDKKLMFYPADKRVIKPIVTSFLESIGQDELISTYGLESFETQCINPRKTICDKVSRLVKLSYNEDAAALLAKHIRDVYDLSALYHNQEYNDYLHSEDFLDAMYRVTIEDGLNKNSRSHLSLADAPIFKDSETALRKSLEPNQFLVQVHVRIVQHESVGGPGKRGNLTMGVDIVPLPKVFHHVLQFRVLSLGLHLVETPLCPDLIAGCHEYLDLGVREHRRADVPAVHNQALFFCHILLQGEQKGADLRDGRNVGGCHRRLWGANLFGNVLVV